MLSLTESIRPTAPSMQRVWRAVADARARTELILAAWKVARVLAVDLVEYVLTARARCPTFWPPCPACGTSLQRTSCECCQ
jgi:hypothetical protein